MANFGMDFNPDTYLSAGQLLIDYRYHILVVSIIVLTMAEIYEPARTPPGTRWKNRIHNLSISAMYLLLGGVLGVGMVWIAIKTEALHIGLFNMLPMPTWLKVMLGFLVFDLAEYVRHRISHAYPALWRVHRIHHSDPLMDVSTAFRNHPLNWITIYPPRALAVVLFGVPPVTLAIYTVVWFVTTSFHHSNISVARFSPRLQSLLDLVIVTPDRHYVHHARTDHSQTDSQFGVVFIFWDKLFGTLTTAPDRRIFEQGLEDIVEESDQTLVGMLKQPFKPVKHGSSPEGLGLSDPT